jgi:hypothetical protein
MREEAEVARIEALLDAGDAHAAASRAHAFLDTHPQSPYARRVRAMLGRADPNP